MPQWMAICIKKNRMKKQVTMCMLAALMLAACGEDEPIAPPSGEVNQNSNAGLVSMGREAYVTEQPASTDCQQVAMRLEVPRLQGGTNNLLVVHTLQGGTVNYCMEYDCSLLASRWTAYRWYKGLSTNEAKWNRKNWESTSWHGDPFQEDPLLPKEYRTTLADHSRNGYDRGHMLSSADRLNSQEANEQTFYLSNMHPQLAGFNWRGIWYNLEDRLQKVYDQDSFRDTLYVVKGGTIGRGQYTLKNRLPVPKHFFMAILCKNGETTQGGYKAIAFWMEHKENRDNDYASYAISIDELERLTGIDFFCNLPDDIERQVESNLVLGAWGLNK